jgi:hypothetical protein
VKKLIYLVLLTLSLPSFARQFDIEVIIFKRDLNPEAMMEQWPKILDPINLDRAISYRDNQMMVRNGATLLASSNYQLQAQYNQLKKHAAFTPMVHVAWRQGDQGRSRAPVFHIQAGQDFSETYLADGRSKAEVAREQAEAAAELTVNDSSSPLNNENTFDEQSADAPLYELDGRLQVYVQHYLFIETQLDLKKPGQRKTMLESEPVELELPTPVSSAVSTPLIETQDSVQIGHLEEIAPVYKIEQYLNTYRMAQKRKMRSSETHYLDHPLLGIIIQVRRVAQ